MWSRTASLLRLVLGAAFAGLFFCHTAGAQVIVANVTVDDIIFDDNGSVDYLVVLNEGKYVTVPWQAAKFDFERRTATVNITEKRFRQVPTYTLEQVPNYGSPVYRQQIYTYYGLRPGQERRLDRREGFRRR